MDNVEITPAILFDFDGTLVDSENIWLEAKIKALLELGISCEESELREFAGQNLNAVFSHFFAASEGHKNQEKLDLFRVNFYQVVDDVALSLVPNYLKEKEGAREVLSRFKEDGFVMAICSNAPTYFIEATLSFLNLDEFVKNIFSAANTDKGKPNPFVYQKAIDVLGLNKKRTLALEDSKSGANAALAAGIPVILLRNSDYSEAKKGIHYLESIKDLTPNFAKGVLIDK